MTDAVDRHLLGIYLNDHVTGATAALARVQRMAQTYRHTPFGGTYQELARELAGERSWLLEVMRDLHLPVRRYKIAGAVLAEQVGRLKPNGRLVQPSRLPPVLETELLRSGISGKHSAWATLALVGERVGMTPAQREHLTTLQQDVTDQLARVDATLEWLRPRVFVTQPVESTARDGAV